MRHGDVRRARRVATAFEHLRNAGKREDKAFHATKVSVMEATRACPYAFPKKIQEEFDRLADEQMLKLKELARRDSLLSSD